MQHSEHYTENMCKATSENVHSRKNTEQLISCRYCIMLCSSVVNTRLQMRKALHLERAKKEIPQTNSTL